MDRQFTPDEIGNPKKTMARRMANAEGEPVGGLIPSTERDKGQRDFLYGPKPKVKDKADEARKRKEFEELLRKRDAEIKESQRSFEKEFSKDSEAPLTEAVAAARAAATKPSEDEDQEYSGAYEATA